MNKKVSFKGATTEIFVPLHSDLSIDREGVQKTVEYQLESGIHGLFVNGIGTETIIQKLEDQIELAKLTVKATNGKVPVMGNIMVSRTDDALKLIDAYEDCGIDAICITQPIFYNYEKDGLKAHYDALISHTKLPVYLYNAPQSSNLLSPEFLADIANTYDSVQGYKDSTQDVIHLQTLMHLVKEESFEFIAGSDATILSTLLLGGVGIISFISTVFPKPIIEVCDAYFAGDIERAKKANELVFQIRKVLKSFPQIAAYKYTAELLGCPGGIMIPPLINLNDKQKAYLKAEFTKLNLI